MKFLLSFLMLLSIVWCSGQDYQITKLDSLVTMNQDTSAQFLEDRDGSIWLFTSDTIGNDNDFQINPDAEEIANNGIDEDCDGMDLTSSTHKLSNSKVSISPNPIFDRIYLKINGNSNYQTTLFDLDGRVISISANMSIIGNFSFIWFLSPYHLRNEYR